VAALPLNDIALLDAPMATIPDDKTLGRGGQSHSKGASGTWESIRCVYHVTDPVELSAGCFDAIENRFAARESRRTAYQITKKLDLRI